MSDMFSPAPAPATELGRHRILSSTAGVRVSPLQLGAMSIGDAWDFMGHMNREQSFKLLDAFVEAGGNFIDTANNYQNEQSEAWIGEWMKERKNRDEIVLATKFTTQYRAWEVGKGPKVSNYTGNSKRSLKLSVRDSLKKLQTDWIDLLYVHWLDYTTSIEELMDSLHHLVVSGQVLYLGISDTPAWFVAAANTYARAHGKTPFSVYQGRWNILKRDFERDILPMANHFGMALAPWDVLGSGKFQSKKAMEARSKAGEGRAGALWSPEQTEEEAKISAAMEEVAAEHGIESVTAIALAYVMCKSPRVFPIIGGRKVEHLQDNIKALSIKLTDEQIKKLEGVKSFDIGFPLNMIGLDPHVTGEAPPLLGASSQLSFLQAPRAIGHG